MPTKVATEAHDQSTATYNYRSVRRFVKEIKNAEKKVRRGPASNKRKRENVAEWCTELQTGEKGKYGPALNKGKPQRQKIRKKEKRKKNVVSL